VAHPADTGPDEVSEPTPVLGEDAGGEAVQHVVEVGGLHGPEDSPRRLG
jgi:hypothetical protein